MTLSELKERASFHELLLINTAIKAHQDMVSSEVNTLVVNTAKNIANDYAEIMFKKFIPYIREDFRASAGIKQAFEEGTRIFNEKYGIK